MYTPAKFNITTEKQKNIPKEEYSSNHHISGTMLNFGGAKLEVLQSVD